MIECKDENIWYIKRKTNRSKKKRFFKCVFIISLILGLIIYYKSIVVKNLTQICVDYAYSYTTESVNNAILNSLNEKIRYEDLISISKNTSGDITLISANSLKVNALGGKIVDETKIILSNKLDKGVDIPLFAFSGIKFLSGYGKNINFKSLSVVSVESELIEKFLGVGINQTLHSLYFKISCTVKIDAPANYQVKTYSTNVLVSEALLVGKVPETYLKG